ncbi:hypothetical protein [Mycolicibacterium peregrinum]|uniref:hypothetical protein n=1 Tax=Mycolicibacterium peregrinum TaxID=43304 RepID=UPI003AABCE3D
MKPQAFTPESLFRVSGLAVRDPADDPYVATGAHLRAWVNPAIGFPLRGFTFIPLRKDALDPENHILVRPLRVFWWIYDDNGTVQPLGTDPEMAIKPDRPLYGDILGPDEEGNKDPWISWIRLDIEEFSPVQISVIGRAGGNQERILLSRSRAPFALAASRIRRIRLVGDGIARNVVGLDASLINREYVDPAADKVQFLLPLDNVSPWADPVVDAGAGIDRAVAGAPRHTGPADLPTDRDTDAEAEAARVDTLITDMGTTSVRSLLQQAYSDPGAYPNRHRTPLSIPNRTQQATTELGTIQTLITAAADPGIARWLGLSCPVQADVGDDSVPVAWIAVGVWAADPAATVAAGTPNTTVAHLIAAMKSAGPDAQAMTAWLPAGAPVDQPLLTSLGLQQLVLVTPAVIGALPDPPAPLALAADGPAQWTAANTYRQDIAILGPPPAGPVAFTRSDSGAIHSQHAFIDVDGTPRALTLLPGRRDLPTGCQGTLVDSSVPADVGPVSWQVAEGDEFGRWGQPGTLQATPPPRPPLPAPRPEAHYFADYDLRDAPPGALSPGTISVEVDVPPPDALGPGTAPITQTSVNGHIVNAPFPGDRAKVSFPAAQTQTGEIADQIVTATFNPNTADSSSATARVRVVDPRRPRPLSTAPRILWSSRRDPVGGAQIDLSWPAEPGHAAYNVYLADEQVVTAQLGVFPESANRATRAAALYDHQHEPMKRESFTLLTPVPLAAGGTVRFAHTIPGSVQTLQFVRVVPLTHAQVEAPFDGCGLTPVAVPGGDQPPAPVVHIGTKDGGLSVQVQAYGINGTVIARLGNQSPPQYRVSCAAAASTSYLYGTEVDEGPLVPVDGSPDTYRADIAAEKLSALPAFVTIAVTAQVRYPAEVATRPGAAPLPSPIANTGGLVDAHPCEWSAPSTPVAAMVTAPTPALDATVHRDAAGGGLELTFTGLPTQHAQQIAPWRLALWRNTANGERHWITPGDAALTVLPPTPSEVDGWAFMSAELHIRDAHADAVGYAALLINPLGQAGPLTEFAAAD